MKCSVQSLSRVRLCNPMNRSMPGLPDHHQLRSPPNQTHVYLVGDAIQPSYPLSSPSPPAFNLSQHQGLFQGVSSSHQSIGISASASVLPLKSWIGLISFRVDLFDPLEVPWTTRLSSLLQHCSSKASILLLSAFLMVQLSHPYMKIRRNQSLVLIDISCHHFHKWFSVW